MDDDNEPLPANIAVEESPRSSDPPGTSRYVFRRDLFFDRIQISNRRHSPIDLAFTWKTKWWPHRQFTFFLGVAEVNACNERGRARRVPAEPMLEF